MTFQTLDYIIAIAEERSISRAADRLLISQPALSRQLKRLEDQLGRKAFRAGTQRNAPDRCRENLCQWSTLHPEHP